MPVVFNHAGLPGFPGGLIGVDIFFVIARYLITRILVRELEEDRFSILRFYERRARRILPALFVVIAVTLAFVFNIWFWYGAGDYFSPSVELEPLLRTWSLVVQKQSFSGMGARSIAMTTI